MLISIPCKIYADILNIRLPKWNEDNSHLVEEIMGFGTTGDAWSIFTLCIQLYISVN